MRSSRPEVASQDSKIAYGQALANYLDFIIGDQPPQIIFSQDRGRVFFAEDKDVIEDIRNTQPEQHAFHLEEIKLLQPVEQSIRESGVLKFLVDFLVQWDAKISPDSIRDVREDFFSHYIKPLMDHNDFQTINMKLNGKNNESQFYQQLLPALAFKLFSILHNKFNINQENISNKFKLLNRLLDPTNSAMNFHHSLKAKHLRQFNFDIAELLNQHQSTKKSSKKNLLASDILGVIKKTIKNSDFKYLSGAEAYLWKHLHQLLIFLWLKQTPEFPYLSFDEESLGTKDIDFGCNLKTLSHFTSSLSVALYNLLAQRGSSSLDSHEINALDQLGIYLSTRGHSNEKFQKLLIQRAGDALAAPKSSSHSAHGFFLPADLSVSVGFSSNSCDESPSSPAPTRSAPELPTPEPRMRTFNST